MQLAQFRRRGRADRRDAHAADVAQSWNRRKKMSKNASPRSHREHQPVVGIHPSSACHDGIVSFGRVILMVEPPARRAEFRQSLRETAACRTPRDDDAPAKQRSLLEPFNSRAISPRRR